MRSLALRDEALSDLVGAATRRALRQIVDTCLDEEVQALLIAGDLYDRDLQSMKTAAFLGAQMERLNEAAIAVFIIRGNHDAESVITRTLELPPNVHVFGAKGGTIRLQEHRVAIHGVSYGAPQAPQSLLAKYPAPLAGWYNIGLLHTSLAGAEGHDTYAPCTVADLANHGYDYWALGHIHKRQVHRQTPHIVMPGMPQGRDIGEEGAKSVTLVTVDEGAVTLEERPSAQVEFHRLSCVLDGVEDWREMLARISATLRAHGASSSQSAIVRLELRGHTSLAWRVVRDFDLLRAQVGEAAAAIGAIWVEKIVSHLRQPEAETPGPAQEDPRHELRAIMQGLASEAASKALAREHVSWLVSQLPPEIRASFGEDEAGLAETVEGLLQEGCAEVAALMMGDSVRGAP